MGLCREKSKLNLYFFIQPVIILVEVVISIIGYVGFNGIIKIVNLFENDQVIAALFALVVTIGFLCMAGFSTFLYVKVWRERSVLTKLLVWRFVYFAKCFPKHINNKYHFSIFWLCHKIRPWISTFGCVESCGTRGVRWESWFDWTNVSPSCP